MQGSLKRAECCDGWKWLTINLYDTVGTHAYYKSKKVQAIMGFPNKLSVKIPSYLNVDRGHVKSPSTIALLGSLLKWFGLCPKQPDRQNSDVPCASLPGRLNGTRASKRVSSQTWVRDHRPRLSPFYVDVSSGRAIAESTGQIMAPDRCCSEPP